MVQSLCPYFPSCGGCLYMDMSEADYSAKKESFIRRAFSDYNLTVDLQPIIQIPLHTRRRACLAFNGAHFGFNARKSHRIIDITNCMQLTDSLNNCLKPLRNVIGQLKTAGDIFILDTPYGIDIHIKTIKSDRPKQKTAKIASQTSWETRDLLADFARRNNVVRLLLNNEPIVEKAKLPFLPDSFLQPSLEGEKTLISLMMEHVTTQKSAVDLFCGSGTFTRPLLNAHLHVKGYDSAADCVAVLGENGCVRDLFRNPLTAEELNGIDFVVMDPPRAGARSQTDALSQTQVPTIILISCNPSTCARDIKKLTENGWRLTKITPVDQFPFSNHIELVCALKK